MTHKSPRGVRVTDLQTVATTYNIVLNLVWISEPTVIFCPGQYVWCVLNDASLYCRPDVCAFNCEYSLLVTYSLIVSGRQP